LEEKKVGGEENVILLINFKKEKQCEGEGEEVTHCVQETKSKNHNESSGKGKRGMRL